MATSPCSFAKIKKLYRKFAKKRDVFRFTEKTGCYATIFQGATNEFVRISTTVPNKNGERAVDTLLDHSSEAYKNLIQGKKYVGISAIDGGYYCEKVAPFITDPDGNVLLALGVACRIKLPPTVQKASYDSIYL